MDGGSSSSSSGGKFKLYEELELQEFQDKFVIKSVQAPGQGFSIGRRDGTIEPLDGKIASIFLFELLSVLFGCDRNRFSCF